MNSTNSSIVRKLLGHTITPAAPKASTPTVSAPPDTAEWESMREPALATKHSQDATYIAGSPILSMDGSPDGRYIALSSRHTLRTVSAERDPARFKEDVDLRAMITMMKGTKASVISDQLSIHDVKWASQTSILTACGSGKIYHYDLVHARSKALFTPSFFSDSARQVQTLDVSPHMRSWVLSGNQDGTVRIWDCRMAEGSRGRAQFQMRVKNRVSPHCEGIRAVKWSPKDGFDFALATESGMVCQADLRLTSGAPRLRIKAHEGAASSLSWHPDGVHLLSAGMDCKLCVWDMSSQEKRQRPRWVVQTPDPVSQAIWRPSLWSATDQGRRATQVAVTYNAASQRRHGRGNRNMVHIWDLARPTIPYKIIERFDTTPTTLLWRDQDVLWAAGEDGNLQQCDVAFAPKVLDRLTKSTFAVSPAGEVITFLDQRAPQVKPRVSPVTNRSGTQTHVMNISRTDSDEDLTGVFLNARAPAVGKIQQRGSARGGPSVLGHNSVKENGAPYSLVMSPDQDVNAAGLAESMGASGVFKVTQTMGNCEVPGRMDPGLYQYLTFHYLRILQDGLHRGEGKDWEEKSLVTRVTGVLEGFSKIAEAAGLFRLAQSWLILRHVVGSMLKRRGEYHCGVRQRRFGRKSDGEKEKESSFKGDRTPVRSLLADELDQASSRTPGMAALGESMGTPLSPVLEGNTVSFSIPTTMDSPGTSLETTSLPLNNHNDTLEGYDFYGTDAFSAALEESPGTDRKEGSWPGEDLGGSDNSGKSASGTSDGKVDGSESPLEQAMNSDEPGVVEGDYFPWVDDPPYPFESVVDDEDWRNLPALAAVDPYVIIQETLVYESAKSAVNASAMVLLLAPLVPSSVIFPAQSEAILRQHHSRLQSLRLFVEAAHLRNLCTSWLTPPSCTASYPSVFSVAQKDTSVFFMCPFCLKPHETTRSRPGALWACDRCFRTLDPCAVCKHRHLVADLKADGEDEGLALWWYCHGCGHGGHAGCLQAWHCPGYGEDGSGGCCPQAGCDCACLPGGYEEEETEEPGKGGFPYVDRGVRSSRRGRVSFEG